jgi:hypothetical protein
VHITVSFYLSSEGKADGGRRYLIAGGVEIALRSPSSPRIGGSFVVKWVEVSLD